MIRVHVVGRIARTITHCVVVLFACALASCVAAQQPLTENVLQAGGSDVRNPASLADLAWMAGRWTGTGLGSKAEEIWSTPEGGAMMGMFRQSAETTAGGDSGGIRFYELMTLSEDQGSLILRIKHFRPDLRGWEEKDERMEFKLLRVTDGRWWFGGLTIERLPVADDQPPRMNIYVVINQDDAGGAPQEALFEYTQVPLP